MSVLFDLMQFWCLSLPELNFFDFFAGICSGGSLMLQLMSSLCAVVTCLLMIHFMPRSSILLSWLCTIFYAIKWLSGINYTSTNTSCSSVCPCIFSIDGISAYDLINRNVTEFVAVGSSKKKYSPAIWTHSTSRQPFYPVARGTTYKIPSLLLQSQLSYLLM